MRYERINANNRNRIILCVYVALPQFPSLFIFSCLTNSMKQRTRIPIYGNFRWMKGLVLNMTGMMPRGSKWMAFYRKGFVYSGTLIFWFYFNRKTKPSK